MPRRNVSNMWDYFDKVDNVEKKAKCHFCGDLYSYRGTIGNLKAHLKKKHPERYIRILTAERQFKSTSDEDDTDQDRKEETEEGSEDVLIYFNYVQHNKVRCILCKETFTRNLALLSKHVNEKHQKVVMGEASDSDEDQNTFTEVVYLEDESMNADTSPIQLKSSALKKRRLSKYEVMKTPRPVENHPKLIESPPRKEVDDEIENFGRYVIGLLKKMPKEVTTQLQMDIINLIMTAKLKLETASTDSFNVTNRSQDGNGVTASNVIVTTPSNVIHTTQSNGSLPTLVIGAENES